MLGPDQCGNLILSFFFLSLRCVFRLADIIGRPFDQRVVCECRPHRHNNVRIKLDIMHRKWSDRYWAVADRCRHRAYRTYHIQYNLCARIVMALPLRKWNNKMEMMSYKSYFDWFSALERQTKNEWSMNLAWVMICMLLNNVVQYFVADLVYRWSNGELSPVM